MAAPAIGEANLPDHHHQIADDLRRELKGPNSFQDDFTVSQLSNSKTSSPPPDPFTPSPPALGKRRKSKPVRYEASLTSEKPKHSAPKLKIVVGDPPRMFLSSRRGKVATKGFNTPVQGSPAMVRAVEIQLSLGNEFPSCIKAMVRSHVISGFWMGLPVPFCKSFMSKKDTTMVLEDENGEQYDVKYIAYKNGLSAGWKNFAFGHKLVEGDVLVFHLIEPCKFKIYIVRANDPKEVDGAFGLLNLEVHTGQATPDNTTETIMPLPKTRRTKRPRSLPLHVVQKKQKKFVVSPGSLPPPQLNSHPVEHSGNDSEEVASEVLEGSRTSKTELSFEEVKTFEDFRIVINGLCIDSELPEDVRINYYTLCLSKNEFLHDVLPQSLYYKLVAGMIGEIVSISNEIKNCKLSTTKEQLEVWDNSLKSFELLGMKVGFLRDRMRLLITLSESEGALDTKRFMEAEKQKNQTKDEIRELEMKLLELKETSRKYDAVVDALKEKAETYELNFQQQVNAPW